MRISVVINTYNRGRYLRDALRSLEYQTYPNFEIVVVNGPSTDNTDAVLECYKDQIKVQRIAQKNLCISRNTGINSAAGEIVAFIDDDSLAHPNWLKEIVEGFTDQLVGAVGGLVYDQTGRRLQYFYSACDRLGRTRFDVRPPFDAYWQRGADPFLYVQGTNMAFRKNMLTLVGGFNEQCEYMHDETEVCMRITDEGYKIVPLDRAVVYHRIAPSDIRGVDQVVRRVFRPVKNHVLFLLRAANQRYSDSEIESEIARYKMAVRQGAIKQRANGVLTDGEYESLVADVEQATTVARAMAGEPRPIHRFDDPDPFLQFGHVRNNENRLHICFISQEYPPRAGGGIGAFTFDIAHELARRGHCIHVVTRQPGPLSVELDDGVWVLRIPDGQPPPEKMAHDPARWIVGHNIEVYRDVEAIHRQWPLDLVVAPAWTAEGLLASLDKRWPTIIWLQTTSQSAAEIEPTLVPYALTVSALEAAAIRNADAVHAISHSILATVQHQTGISKEAFVIPLGLRPQQSTCAPTSKIAEILEQTKRMKRVLFVGRLEPRKGIDILLDAIPSVVKQSPSTAFLIVGRPILLQSLGNSDYQSEFRKQHGNSLDSNVFFLGEVAENDRNALYASSDIFCAPSRYESFGLVLLEAMRAGTPIVTSDLESFQEIVASNEVGIFFKSGDADDLVEKLMVALRNDQRRMQWAANALARFRIEFDVATSAERLLAQYTRVSRSFRRAPDGAVRAEFRSRLRFALENLSDGVKRDVDSIIEVVETRARAHEIIMHIVKLISLSDRSFVTGLHDLFAVPIKLRQRLFARRRIKRRGGRIGYLRGLIARTNLFLFLLAPSALEQLIAAEQRFTELRRSPAGLRGAVSVFTKKILGRKRLHRIHADIRSTQSDVSHLLQVGNATNTRLDKLQQHNDELDGEMTALRSAFDVMYAYLINSMTIQTELTRSFARTLGDGIQEQESIVTRSFATLREELVPYKLRLSEQHQVLIELESELAKWRGFFDGGVLDTFGGAIRTLDERIASLAKRMEFVRSELFFEMEARGMLQAPTFETSTAPVVVNLSKIDAFRRKGGIRLNLGCGHLPLDGYINCDKRALPSVDVIAAVDKLPFERGEVVEIFSAHLLEHFPHERLRRALLPYWKTLLIPGGIFRAVVPDMQAMLEAYAVGNMTFADLRTVTFGGQEYEGDYHFDMFSRAMIRDLLCEVGFVDIMLPVTGRRNGLCYEMEVEARLPGCLVQ
jgi:glycosyltransferase involved in cell wall biosynthesis/predicted SAM-dependent methyltransferase